MSDGAVIAFFTSIGGWVGFLFSLLIFSSLLGDHRLARLAQYVLVGLSMGYLGVLAVQYGLRPFFERSLVVDTGTPWRALTWLLALMLLLAGGELILSRGRGDAPGNAFVRWLGLIPVGLMVGVGVTVALIGIVQVTLSQQAWLIITHNTSASGSTSNFDWLLSLLLSAGVLFQLTVHPERHLSWQFAPLRQLMQVWMWVGQRALWFAAGLLFVRIFAARYMLLIALLEQWRNQILTSGLW
ncbi:MAG: hypothetical protein U0175_33255 [Caldilineaceae bacterium]